MEIVRRDHSNAFERDRTVCLGASLQRYSHLDQDKFVRPITVAQKQACRALGTACLFE